jgi:hypothetical protein
MRPETSDKRLAIGERCTLIRWIWCGVRGRALENSATAVRDVAKLGAPWGCTLAPPNFARLAPAPNSHHQLWRNKMTLK